MEPLYAILTEPEQGPVRLRLLCSSLLRTLAPSRNINIEGFDPPVDRRHIPLLLPVLLGQGVQFFMMAQCLPQVVQWLVANAGLSETSIRLAATSFIGAVARNHPNIMRTSRVSQLNAYLLSALRGATLNAAPEADNKSTGLFSPSKSHQSVMTEFDNSKASGSHIITSKQSRFSKLRATTIAV